MKKNRNNDDKFVYPHPIIKTFTSIPQQTHHHAPFAYQNFHVSDSNSISQKLLRSSHINPLFGSSFSLLLHPLHPKVEINSYNNNDLLHCKKCQSALNSASIKKLSLFQLKCKYCGHVTQSELDSGRYVDLNVLDRVEDNQKYQQCVQSSAKILFVIEANQFLYNKQIHTSIFQCLHALVPQLEQPKFNKSISLQTEKSQSSCQQQYQSKQREWATQLKIGFMFYDDERNYIMNLSTNQLVVLQQQHFQNQNQFPFTENQILLPLHSINLEELESIVQQIMYSSFEMKVGCLVKTLKICDMLAKMWKIQTKMFVCSYDSSILQQKAKKQNIDQKKVNPSKTSIDPRVQISLVNGALLTHISNLGLSSNINKFYSYNQVCPADIYYDLYHNLTQSVHYQVDIQICTSQLLSCSKPKIKIPVLSSNTPVILDIQIPQHSSHSKTPKMSTLQFQDMLNTQCIQIKIKLNNYSTRIITYSVPKINTSAINQPYLLNDQTFFYVMVYKMLNDKTIHSMKKAIVSKATEIVSRILNCQDGEFVIPKNLTNFFMYAFMVSHHQIYEKKNSDFLHEKAFFMREGLQTITKKIYPKVYEFYPYLRPLKYKPKSFLHDSIRLVDNGLFIGIVVGDQVLLSTLNELFGVKDIDEALDWKQVPVLNTFMNQKLHDAISMLRQLNQMYYLPIKIIRFDSHIYEEYYGNYLYIEQDHKKFFMNCFKN